ncbi:hypothetical protein NRA55_14085 [Acinetobacter baumannii]|nr:hypothetical protein [Acinetobacter baumannii]
MFAQCAVLVVITHVNVQMKEGVDMDAKDFIGEYGIKKATKVVDAAPSNAESFQDGYYFRTKPQFEFHNGFHPVWNITDNDGAYFKKRGFDPVGINDLKMALESFRIVEQFGGLEKAKFKSRTKDGMGYLKECIADVEAIYANPKFAYTILSGAQVGAVLTVAQQIDDMGDDSNLDHHVSPFCEVRDV